MSADNFIVIFKDHDGRFRGYMGFASDELSYDEIRARSPHGPMFDWPTLEEAIASASEEYTEYGVRFADGVLPKKDKSLQRNSDHD